MLELDHKKQSFFLGMFLGCFGMTFGYILALTMIFDSFLLWFLMFILYALSLCIFYKMKNEGRL